MRTILAVAGLVGVIASLPGHAQVTKGALGPVEALGQAVGGATAAADRPGTTAAGWNDRSERPVGGRRLHQRHRPGPAER